MGKYVGGRHVTDHGRCWEDQLSTANILLLLLRVLQSSNIISGDKSLVQSLVFDALVTEGLDRHMPSTLKEDEKWVGDMHGARYCLPVATAAPTRPLSFQHIRVFSPVPAQSLHVLKLATLKNGLWYSWFNAQFSVCFWCFLSNGLQHISDMNYAYTSVYIINITCSNNFLPWSAIEGSDFVIDCIVKK
jgi:hypothetical protein